MPEAVPIFLSVPTSAGGATAAATFGFFTSGYRAPRQGRSTSQDIVHNQNGIFKYRYDNGPNVHTWEPFRIIASDTFRDAIGSATQQLANLDFLWNYVEGPLGMAAPDGVYSVDWANAPLERVMLDTPLAAGDKIKWAISVAFEEA